MKGEWENDKLVIKLKKIKINWLINYNMRLRKLGGAYTISLSNII